MCIINLALKPKPNMTQQIRPFHIMSSVGEQASSNHEFLNSFPIGLFIEVHPSMIFCFSPWCLPGHWTRFKTSGRRQKNTGDVSRLFFVGTQKKKATRTTPGTTRIFWGCPGRIFLFCWRSLETPWHSSTHCPDQSKSILDHPGVVSSARRYRRVHQLCVETHLLQIYLLKYSSPDCDHDVLMTWRNLRTKLCVSQLGPRSQKFEAACSATLCINYCTYQDISYTNLAKQEKRMQQGNCMSLPFQDQKEKLPSLKLT